MRSSEGPSPSLENNTNLLVSNYQPRTSNAIVQILIDTQILILTYNISGLKVSNTKTVNPN